MLFLLSKLPYKLKGHRSIDYVIFLLRKVSWALFLFGTASLTGVMLLAVMRKQAANAPCCLKKGKISKKMIAARLCDVIFFYPFYQL